MNFHSLSSNKKPKKQLHSSFIQRFFSSHKTWVFVFFVWLLFISGIGMRLSQKNDITKPGILQAYELYQIKLAKEAQIENLESTLEKLELEKEALLKNPIAQEREIRKVLGYAQKNEIIFDFSNR